MRSKRRIDPPEMLSLEEFPRLQGGLVLLGQAYHAAEEAGADVWDFSIDGATVRKSGLTNRTLEWLVRHKYVECRRDDASSTATTRTRSKAKRYVATKAGAEFARKLLEAAGRLAGLAAGNNPHFTDGRLNPIPHWDALRRELRYGSVLVKRLTKSAPNQECILAAFQEEGWPKRIDDPLPPKAGLVAKVRLHDAINRLNSNMVDPLIRFGGDGTGIGICWVVASAEGPMAAKRKFVKNPRIATNRH